MQKVEGLVKVRPPLLVKPQKHFPPGCSAICLGGGRRCTRDKGSSTTTGGDDDHKPRDSSTSTSGPLASSTKQVWSMVV